MAKSAQDRSRLIEATRRVELRSALRRVRLSLPSNNYPLSSRRTKPSLLSFVDLIRGQTEDDYRPNKLMSSVVIETVCTGYPQLERLKEIVSDGVRAHVCELIKTQKVRPANHNSAQQRQMSFGKTFERNKMRGDDWSWTRILLSFGPRYSSAHLGWSIKQTVTHHLSDAPFTTFLIRNPDQSSIPATEYVHCDAIAKEILQVSRNYPDVEIEVMAGDVTAASRNVSIHSDSVRWFGGLIEEEQVLILDLCCPFGWAGSPGHYEIVRGAIVYAHGVHTNTSYPNGFFIYHWGDDHVNVTANIGSNCADLERSLRFAITAVLGDDAVNEDKFTGWSSTEKILGLQFDCNRLSVSMPADKIEKVRYLVSAAFHTQRLSRRSYHSLLGSVGHVATCVRLARPFLQRLRQREFQLHRFEFVTVTVDMKADLRRWWWLALHSPHMNGMPLVFFNDLPPPDVIVETDAPDFGLCALGTIFEFALTYRFFSSGVAVSRNVQNDGRQRFRYQLSRTALVRLRCVVLGPAMVGTSTDYISVISCSLQDRQYFRCNWEMKHSLRFSASHIPGVDNSRADAGSRLGSHVSFANHFASCTTGWLQESPNLDISGLTTLWQCISELNPLRTPPSPSTPARWRGGKYGRHGKACLPG
ncbi:hypothetical protein PHMEG_00022623 [Phytophthora megakarya]|uniref:Cleavage induced protein n=1 Tax=Phytophthora megakarya TaxID=4795 RepID=A0A225VJW9_9STRA|nr:hypothetical protein PHMEG_00022623 [Phytophthora megakarya]